MTGLIGQTTVRPDSQTQLAVQLEVVEEFGTNEAGVEEYYAVATIVPEVRGDMRISIEVKIDLEP